MTESVYYHPRFNKTPPREWLKNRNKYPTGFCNPYQPLSGQSHEGDKVNRRVCDFWDSCPCYCHYMIDQMYEMAGLPREPAEQGAEYLAKRDHARLETDLMLESITRNLRQSTILSNDIDTFPRVDIEGTAAGQLDSAHGTLDQPLRPQFAPTPTGRRARGQLEYDVLEVCNDFASGVYDWEYCTPKLVAEQIGKKYAVEPPSTGAINAVWDRWEKIEFAVQDKKPSRFVKFTGKSTPEDLELLKGRMKRQKKRTVAEQRRGIPRPVRRK